MNTKLSSSLLAIALLGACKPETIAIDPNAPQQVPRESNPTWKNWSQNLVHAPTRSGENYYFMPTNLAELQAILARRPAGVNIRVSGQRHSQPPLVIDDDRSGPETANTWLIDLSCYSDLGPSGDQRIVLDPTGQRVTVNTGVREDQLDAFLTANNLMLATVTAGGFFSIGGMTAVDVHGATIAAPIFAETASAFTIVGADGKVTTMDEDSPAVGGWSPLQFARVSLGALGVVTSVTIDVQPRPYATTMSSGHERHKLKTEADFIARYQQLLADHDRLESFYNPYSHEFLVLWWDRQDDPTHKKPNQAPTVTDACSLAEANAYGAPYEKPAVEKPLEKTELYVETHGDRLIADALIGAALLDIELQVNQAARHHSDLWLAEAAEVIFMSYFVELPAVDEAGLAKVWQGLQAINHHVSDEFVIAGPLEFRFIRGGNSALAGTYTSKPDALFVNLDLIGFVAPGAASSYPPALLEFFARVERDWVGLGGWPHNGKMYGFYDPASEGATAPFNPAYLQALAQRRGDRVTAFESFRRSSDPEGVFCNDYLRSLMLCGV
jgi:FAD/FMN-containing dehydrogenase